MSDRVSTDTAVAVMVFMMVGMPGVVPGMNTDTADAVMIFRWVLLDWIG